MNIKRMTLLAMYTTIALTIFVVESAIPPLAPHSGYKAGLGQCNYPVAADLCNLEGRPDCPADADFHRKYGNRTTGLLFSTASAEACSAFWPWPFIQAAGTQVHCVCEHYRRIISQRGAD